MTTKGFLVGILFVVAGGLVIYFHRQLYSMFGNIGRAEKVFGDGSVAYPLIGVAIVVVGVLLMFGIGGDNPTEITAGFGE